MQCLLKLFGLLWLLLVGGENNVTFAFSPTTPTSTMTRTHPRFHEPGMTSSTSLHAYQVSIEYCTGCRWGLRAFWFAQELLSTFQNDAGLSAVTLIPSRPSDTVKGGRFVVKCHKDGDTKEPLILWNREEKASFPEPKQLKQLVRDVIDPDLYLGHSDTTKAQERAAATTTASTEAVEVVVDLTTEAPLERRVDSTLNPVDIQNRKSPNVAITYCTGCKWLLRAAYYGQDLLATFDDEVNSLTLIPSRPPFKGGAFAVHVDGDAAVLWDRFVQGRFPESKELKQLLRDQLFPSKDLGLHIDGSPRSSGGSGGGGGEMSEDEAEHARKFFGVQ
jgi:selenoprotein W-related protein